MIEGPQDLADLQRQVLDHRASLERAWQVQLAERPPEGSIATAWPDLASRSWDFGHESFSLLDPSGQDDRGRGLLRELVAMDARFRAEGIGVAALPAAAPQPAPSNDPSHATPAGGLSIASLFQGGSSALLVVLVLFFLSQKKGRW